MLIGTSGSCLRTPHREHGQRSWKRSNHEIAQEVLEHISWHVGVILLPLVLAILLQRDHEFEQNMMQQRGQRTIEARRV